MDYAPSDLEELKQLEMKPNDKMSYVAFKIAQYATVDFKDGPKTTNLDALTKSFDNLKDTTAVKIVAFSVLIALLRTKRSYLDALSIEEIEVILDKDEFARLFDERLLKFFKSNKDMFKKITDPDISGGDSHDLHHH
jgi:hypothetical protein